jgi:hypothetical protein
VLAIGPKVHGIKPRWDNVFLSAIKICNTPSFGGEVNPDAPCYVIVACKKNHLQVWIKILSKAKFSFLLLIPSACYQMTLLVGLPKRSDGWVRNFPLSTSSSHHASSC